MTSKVRKSQAPAPSGKRQAPKMAKAGNARRATKNSATPPRGARSGRNPRVAVAEAASVSSSQAKSAFRQLIQRAKRGPVYVTNHNRREAVVLSVDEYERLLANQSDPLADMSDHFDALLAKMQAPGFVAGVDALFDSTPGQLGKAAVKASRGG